MPLDPGTRLGPYEIVAAIGAGGMGEVYRARDTKLNRDVALKILPAEFALDAERLARFKREAQVLASLDHPNIGAIYGFEDSEGGSALVLQLVEGPTLADRLAEGPIPIDEALPIARQMAEALEAAHDQGIIHRDLKPDNIKVTADGRVRVLDFGLAKLLDADAASSGQMRGYSPGGTNSPTITTPAMMTGVGVILGTAAYMSPEQAKGRAADKRSDIWAFGCVLYEMVTGKRPFDGEDVGDTLAAVLRGEPDWTALASSVPAAIRALLQSCLEKDPRKRLGNISTILFLLQHRESLAASAGVVTSRSIRPGPVMTAVAALLVVGALGIFSGRAMRQPASPPGNVVRFTIALPEEQRFRENGNHILAISPDGKQLVYVANSQLFLRSLSELEPRPIGGTQITEGLITAPVFSPDGQSIAYWVSQDNQGAVKKISLTGGSPATLAEIGGVNGMSWGPSGILVGLRNNTIVRVPANGGQPELLATVARGRLWGPQMLPGGDSILFSLAASDSIASEVPPLPGVDDWNKAHVMLHSLKTGEETTLVESGGADARYLPTGHIVYLSGSTLFAVPIDLARKITTDRSVPMVENIGRPYSSFFGGTNGAAYAVVSESGTLAYVSRSPTIKNEVAVVESTGEMQPFSLPTAQYQVPRVSPDGKRFAVERGDNVQTHIWIGEIARPSSLQQLTLEGKKNRFPVWSPDSQRIAFQSDREGDNGIFVQRSDGSGAAQRLTKADGQAIHVPHSWSRDGGTLLFSEVRSAASFALRALSMNDGKMTSFGDVRSVGYSPAATFSPDGRWVAYTVGAPNGTAAAAQVFVQPFPATGAIYPVARGVHPLWSRDGRQLFYHRLPDTPNHMEKVTVTSDQQQVNFTFSTPVSLPLRDMQYSPPNGERNWDTMPDGTRFLGVEQLSDFSATRQINVVLNWFEELKQRVPMK
jgi:serine/threonine-protein kinase